MSHIPAPARWQVLFAAPHRPLLFAGALQIVLTLAWWVLELAARVTGSAWLPAPLLPTTWVHAFLMVYGVFPFFVFGFLFTVFPRWMGGPVIPRRAYSAVFALLLGGVLLFYTGLYSHRVLVDIALLIFFAGWAGALWNLLAVYRHARGHGPHERLLNLAIAAGLVGVGCYLAGAVTDASFAFRLAREIGLWLFLVPVVFLVGHRMIPFFSQSAIMHYRMVRPAWGPAVVLTCAAAHALFELAGLPAWRFLADLPLALAALYHSYVWQFRVALRVRLVAMLHIAFLWLGVAMLLYALQSLTLLATGTDVFGRAALHALGIGFFTSMVVAMASRISLGHSGRALTADTVTWAVLVGVNLSALLRIAGEFLPAHGALLHLLAGLVWLVSLLAWVARYAPMYLQPRADHQPG